MRIQRAALVFLFLWLPGFSAYARPCEPVSEGLQPVAQKSIPCALTRKIPNLALRQLAELTDSDGQAGDGFGSGIAISGDTAVVGGFGNAYVFVKPAGGWGNAVQTAELSTSDGGELFNSAVSIDGDTIIVGGVNYPQSDVYVYVRPSTGWRDATETARLSTTTVNEYVGSMVAISGSTVLTSSGAGGPALVYQRPEGGWQTTSTPSATLNSLSVASFAIAGNTIIVGEGYDALVFLEPQGGWAGNVSPTAQLVPSDLPNYFGSSVAIDKHALTVAVAARACGLCYTGELYVFAAPPQGWIDMTPTAKLEVPDNFGLSTVAINEGGQAIVAGSPGATVGANQDQGAVYVFVKPANGWKTTARFNAKLTASDGASNYLFGTSARVSGSTIIAGAPGATVGSNSYQGAAYVFGK